MPQVQTGSPKKKRGSSNSGSLHIFIPKRPEAKDSASTPPSGVGQSSSPISTSKSRPSRNAISPYSVSQSRLNQLQQDNIRTYEEDFSERRPTNTDTPTPTATSPKDYYSSAITRPYSDKQIQKARQILSPPSAWQGVLNCLRFYFCCFFPTSKPSGSRAEPRSPSSSKNLPTRKQRS